MQINDDVRFLDRHGNMCVGHITEGLSHRAVEGCTITKYGNGSMGRWAMAYRITANMKNPDGTYKVGGNGLPLRGLMTVEATKVWPIN